MFDRYITYYTQFFCFFFQRYHKVFKYIFHCDVVFIYYFYNMNMSKFFKQTEITIKIESFCVTYFEISPLNQLTFVFLKTMQFPNSSK